MNKEVYVTGANGFIGSNLTKRIDHFTPIPHKEIATTVIDPYSRFFFLSTYGNMADHDSDTMILQANVGDLTRIIKQTDFNKINSFIYTSTSSVRLENQTMYSRTKRAAEQILFAFMEKYNAPICIIRPFSVTGVGEQKEHLIPTLIRSCMEGELVNFVPDPVHDFIDVEDVVSGIMNLSNHKARGIYELGSGKQYTNAEVLKMVEKETGKKATVNVVESMRDYDTEEWVSQNYKARGFGWLPKKSLETSISEMVEDYANRATKKVR